MCLKQEYSRQNNSRKYLSESVSLLRQNVFSVSPNIQGVSEGIVNILGGGSMDYSE